MEILELPRVIPCLLIDRRRLVKTVRFRNPKYVGDPMNAVRIFNDKEVDELLILDIHAARTRARPDFEYVHQLASECFMPLAYGGGIQSLEDASTLFSLGVEKVCLNTAAYDDGLMRELIARFGAQSIVASIDVKCGMFSRYSIKTHGGVQNLAGALDDHLARLGALGVGEILINSVDRDGMMGGYDLSLIRRVASSVSVPVIACGGAGTTQHLRDAIVEGGASAVSAGSMFVYSGPHRAVLITYPERSIIKQLLSAAVR